MFGLKATSQQIRHVTQVIGYCLDPCGSLGVDPTAPAIIKNKRDSRDRYPDFASYILQCHKRHRFSTPCSQSFDVGLQTFDATVVASNVLTQPRYRTVTIRACMTPMARQTPLNLIGVIGGCGESSPAR